MDRGNDLEAVLRNLLAKCKAARDAGDQETLEEAFADIDEAMDDAEEVLEELEAETLEARSAPEAASAEGSQPPFPTLDLTLRVLLSYLDGGPVNAPYDEYRALETAIAEWMGQTPSHPSGPSQDSGAPLVGKPGLGLADIIKSLEWLASEEAAGQPRAWYQEQARAAAWQLRDLTPARPSQDSQEVREAVARLLSENQHAFRYIGCWQDWPESIHAEFLGIADRILALLSQSPKGAAGADYMAVTLELERVMHPHRERLRRAMMEWVKTRTPNELIAHIESGVGGPSAPKTGLRGADAPGEAGARLVEIEASSTAQTAYNELLRITNRADDTYIRASVPESVAREIIFRINAFNGAPGDVGSAGGAAHG